MAKKKKRARNPVGPLRGDKPSWLDVTYPCEAPGCTARVRRGDVVCMVCDEHRCTATHSSGNRCVKMASTPGGQCQWCKASETRRSKSSGSKLEAAAARVRAARARQGF